MAKKNKVLIIGSGGFILGNFIRQIFYNKAPYSVSSIDRVRESHIIHNIYVNTNHDFYIADILDKHILHVIFEKVKPDFVIHGGDSTSNITDNIIGIQNIINECVRNNSKLIYLSDDKIYGNSILKLSETAPYNPETIYSVSKVSSELLIKVTSGLQYNILRLGHNYGPWQTVDNYIPNIINSIIENINIEVYNNGLQVHEWTHVFDTCSAILTIIDKWIDGEIYNITSGQEFNDLEVAQIICNTLDKGHSLIKHVEKECDTGSFMKNDKIKELGWTPQFKFRDGIVQTCQWYINNKYVLKM